MSNPIGKDDQLVIIVYQPQPFRGGTWRGSLEIDGGKEYSYSDILKLANDQPETIMFVFKVDAYGKAWDITDSVFDFVKKQP